MAIGANIIGTSASACMVEPLPNAKIFDAPPQLLDKGTKAARFEVIKIENGYVYARLKQALFGHNAGRKVRFTAGFSTCTLDNEVWGDDYGAVTRYRTRDGRILMVLRSYAYTEVGCLLGTRRIAKGPPSPEFSLDGRLIQ